MAKHLFKNIIVFFLFCFLFFLFSLSLSPLSLCHLCVGGWGGRGGSKKATCQLSKLRALHETVAAILPYMLNLSNMHR